MIVAGLADMSGSIRWVQEETAEFLINAQSANEGMLAVCTRLAG